MARRLALLFCALILLQAQASGFSFAVFGDNHANDAVMGRLIDSVNADRSIEFVVNLGDFTNNGSRADYLKYLEAKKKFNVPVHTVKGNHDAVGRGYSYFSSFIGDPYYSFTREGALFIVIDNALRGNFDRKQYEWLSRELKRDIKGPKFVFFHKPVFDSSGMIPDHALDSKRNAARMMELFRGRRVSYAFAGHIHAYGRSERDSVVYIVTGGGGGRLHIPRFAGGFHHYVKVTVNDGKIIDEVVALDD